MRTEYEINMKNKRKGSQVKYEEQVLQQNENSLSVKVNVIKSKLSELQANLQDSLFMIQAERENIVKSNQEKKDVIAQQNKLQESPPPFPSQTKQILGPQVLFHSPIEKSGDDHPEEDESNEEQQQMQVGRRSDNFEFNFQNDIVRKLKSVLALSQVIRGVCSQKEKVEESPILKNVSSSMQQFPPSYTNISLNPLSPIKRKNQRQMTQRAAAEQRIKQALIKKASFNNSDLSPIPFLSNLNSKSYEQSPYLPNPFDSSVVKYDDDSMQIGQTETVRKNLSIYFGHQNWNLVLNMMIGIRQAIVDLYPSQYDKSLQEAHYNEQKMYDLYPKKNYAYDIRDSCKFYDYAPKIFERIRQLYGIQNESYRRSIGPEALLGNLIMGNLSNLTEKCSSGKSGSFFYYSYDDQYMLKTISKEEFVFFRKIIKPYFLHLNNYKDTLVIKIYGLHHMEVYQSKNKYKDIYFCVMGNLFRWNRDVNYRYDLKGSTYGRTARSSKQQIIQIDCIERQRLARRQEIHECVTRIYDLFKKPNFN